MRTPFFLPALLLLAVAVEALAASRDPNVAAYDAILAGLEPSQATVALGDMIVPVGTVRLWRDRLAGTAAPSSASQTGIAKWPGGNVYYTFNGTVSAADRVAFLDGAREWETFANVRFIVRTAEPNYIVVEDVPGFFGGSSAVGMIGGAQQLRIGSDYWNRGTIVHEVGHALGLIHEHQRSDRDTFVTIHFSNVPGGMTNGNFTLIPTSTNHGAYDFLSVMHYGRKTLALNPALDTITPKAGYTQFIDVMGGILDRVLSRGDREGIALMYPPAPVLTTVVTNTNDSGPGSLRAAIYKALDLATDTPGATPTITFQIPNTDPNFSGGVFMIRPTDRMTAPGPGTTIDATTQTVFTGNTNATGPEVVLNGARQVSPDTFGLGLRLTEANTTVKGIVFNGFATQGILITGAGATGNKIEGCYIGTNAAGTAAAANTFAGIEINGGATGNRIGGTTAAARNVISGNASQGIFVRGAGTGGNFIEGNYIGTNAAGTGALANGFAGIEVNGGSGGNIVGGSVAGAGNVLSGNLSQGVAIVGSQFNTVAGNFIGTNPAGTAAIANGMPAVRYSGVGLFSGASNNTIGGGNLISGNTAQGIFMTNAGTNSNLVAGNFIGVNAAGVAAVANGFSGVEIGGGAQNNVVGGTSVSARNVISGNTIQGVFLNSTGTNGNRVLGNYIGTNLAGSAAVANAGVGVEIWNGPSGNTIGGATPGAGNVISGNANRNVLIIAATGNTVAGNLIGLNAAGTAALVNGGPGVQMWGGASGNTIGGTSGGRNFISGNTSEGLTISDSGTNANLIAGNSIGLTPSGAIVANSGNGISIFGGPQNNVIGGSAVGAANLISGNGGAGLALYDASTTGTRIGGNSIFANGGLGIDLGGFGVTANDANDADAGPNHFQNFPVLTAAVLGTGTTVTGTLNSNTSAGGITYRVEFFANPPGLPTGADEGRNFVGAISVTTNASGAGSFNATLPAIVPAGQFLTATATDPAGNTSEFSANRVVTTTDTDGDGLPNAYEAANGLSTAVNDAALDRDGDGMTNAQEFRAGTDPQNPASVFRLAPPVAVGVDQTLSLTNFAGRTYRIDYADLLGSPTPWRILADQIPGTGANIPITDPGAAALPQRFYRAVVVP